MSRTSSNSSRSSDKTTYSNTSSSEEEYSDDDNNYEAGSESASGGSSSNSGINKSDAGGAELETQPRETRTSSSETLHPCYEDYMPDQEPPLATSRAANSETGSQASVKSEAPSLTHESLTEILAEAFFRAGQKGEKTFPQSEPEPEIAATLLSQVGVKPAAKRKVNPPTKKAAGIEGVASRSSSSNSRQTTSQTKKKLANFQKLQKQLASQIDELLEQLE